MHRPWLPPRRTRWCSGVPRVSLRLHPLRCCAASDLPPPYQLNASWELGFTHYFLYRGRQVPYTDLLNKSNRHGLAIEVGAIGGLRA